MNRAARLIILKDGYYEKQRSQSCEFGQERKAQSDLKGAEGLTAAKAKGDDAATAVEESRPERLQHGHFSRW